MFYVDWEFGGGGGGVGKKNFRVGIFLNKKLLVKSNNFVFRPKLLQLSYYTLFTPWT